MSRTHREERQSKTLGKIPNKHRKKFTRFDDKVHIEVKGLLKRHWRKKNIRHEENQTKKLNGLDYKLRPI